MSQAIFDFETEGIRARPDHPPLPVGLALTLPGLPLSYFAWGHDSENGFYQIARNGRLVKCEGDPKRLAAQGLRDAKKCDSVLGHNSSKFDWDVAETHMGIKAPSWEKCDDSLFSRFLADPHAPDLKLKNSAERVLGEPPSEQDAVFEWLWREKWITKKTVAGRAKYQKDAGAYISKAPGSLVAAYAIGDLTRAKGLFDHDMKIVKRDGMLEAYRVEQQVAPILLRNEREGMRVDVPLLEKDLHVYTVALAKVEKWLRKKIQAPASINWNSDAEVAACLRKCGQVKIFPKTPTGLDSVSSKRLTAEFFSDPDIYRGMVYRSIVDYVLSQNIRPWLETALRSGGRVFTEWNQVRSDRDHGGGARSGRVTCSKWANIIKDPTGGKNPDYLVADDERIRRLIGLPELPLARKYCLPDEGELFGHVDINQQEIRLTAHYEEAELARAYREQPDVDIHKFCTDLINLASGQGYVRAVIKHVNLRQFYGGGKLGLVAHPMLRLDKKCGCKLGCPHQENNCAAYQAAGKIVADWRAGLPGVVDLTDRLKKMYARGEPIRTLGGRLYRCKPDAVATKGPRKGETVQFFYTALNYLIQPSGADWLKRILINYESVKGRCARLIGTVYDEVNISAPKKIAKEQVKLLQRVVRDAVDIDVPKKVDGDVRANWAAKGVVA